MQFWLYVTGTSFNSLKSVILLACILYCLNKYTSRGCAYLVVLGGMIFKSTFFLQRLPVVLVYPYVQTCNVFPATRKSLEPVDTAQSIDGAKRALGSLLNDFNGTVAIPAHWHLRDEIIVAGTDVGRIGGGVIEHLPAPAIQQCLYHAT